MKEARSLLPLNSNGCFFVGQLSRSVCGNFDGNKSLAGILDEVRVWTRQLTDNDVMSVYNKVMDESFSPQMFTEMFLYWGFDTHGDGGIDMSGSNNYGAMGILPGNNRMTWSADRPRRFSIPSKPIQVKSGAPVVANKLVQFYTDGDTSVVVKFALDEGQDISVFTETPLGSNGTVTEVVSKENVFSETWENPGGKMQTFTFTIRNNDSGENVTQTIDVLPYEQYVPYNPLYLVGSKPVIVFFGRGIGSDGERESAKVSGQKLPCGTVHQLHFKNNRRRWDSIVDQEGLDESYLVTLNGSSTTELSYGAVIYSPYANISQNELCAAGKYSFEVTIECNNKKETIYLQLTAHNVPFFEEVLIQFYHQKEREYNVSASLLMKDPENNRDVGYYIDRFPVLGTITSDSQPIPTTSTTIEQYVERVVEIGVHNYDPTEDVTEILCHINATEAAALIGPPDALRYIPSDQAYNVHIPESCIAAQTDTSVVIIIVEFKVAVLLDSVSIHESYNPGSVIRIRQKGNDSEWDNLFIRDEPYFELQQSRLTTFSPNICGLSTKTKLVEITFNTSGSSNFFGHYVDAISVVGAIDKRLNFIAVKKQIGYLIPNGIHRFNTNETLSTNTLDTFTYVARDCFGGVSEPVTAKIGVQRGNTTFTERLSFALAPEKFSDVLQFNMTSILADAIERGFDVETVRVSVNEIIGLQVFAEDDIETPLSIGQNLTCDAEFCRIIVKIEDEDISDPTADFDVIIGAYAYRTGIRIIVIDVDKVHPIVIVIIYILGSLAIAYAIFLWILTLFWRDTNQMKTASIVFLILILAGAIMLFISTLLNSSNSIGECISIVWLASLGYTCTYGTLFIRTYRVWRIFSNKKVRPVILPDTKLVAILGCLCLVDIIILVSMHIFGDVRIESKSVGTNKQMDTCNVGTVWVVMLLVYKSLLVIFGIFISVSVRHVSSAYNESTYIGFAIYNLALTASVFVPLIFLVNSDLTVTALLIFVLLWLSTVITISVVFMPKILSILRGERLVHMQNSKANYSMKFIKRSSSKKTTASNSRTEVLRGTIEKLEKHVADLQKQLKDACIVENNDISRSTCESYPTEASSIEGEIIDGMASPGFGTLPDYNDVMISDITETEYDSDSNVSSRSFNYSKRRARRKFNSNDSGITSRSKSEIKNISVDSDVDAPAKAKTSKSSRASRKNTKKHNEESKKKKPQ
eukprot:CAMPEP_0168534452 /NCGR_PEP_ID=MMETSP0405-20121227/17939_1 /TAXON_ID=498012 /ORGANISM="Trichosphaerium sp, Strain Am-I-7 wt" /LENGTH=1204 /DNA_ID=CAMNT_0008561223 /DNA_START=513 /DNA_END=4127 /DNA_ORIENTATION=+